MTLEEALYSDIAGVSAITDLVGTRIYPLTLPQDTAFPAITYQRVSTQRPPAHDGSSGIATARLQLDVNATTLLSAKTIAGLIRSRYHGWSAQMGGGSGVVVSSIFVDDEQDFFDNQTGLKTVIVDLVITYSE